MTASPNPKSKSNIRFIFGIILIACGWVICFDLFALIFGIAFFVLGTVLVLFSQKSWVVKSLVVGVPIILWFVGFKLILNAIDQQDAVAIVVPADFSGQVRVVYGEKNGIVPETKNGRMFFTVPQNGIVITKSYIKPGLTDIEYYSLSANGAQVKLPSMKSPDDKTVARPAGYFEGTLSSDPKTGANLDYIYDAFFILGNDSVKVPTAAAEMVKNPLTDSLVKVLRAKQ